MVSNKLIKVQKYERTEFGCHVAENHFMMAYKLSNLNSKTIRMIGRKEATTIF